MPIRPVIPSVAAGVLAALALSAAAHAQTEDLHAWSVTTARGALDLCRADAPDAARVIDHGAIWGWQFVEYLEHPKNYRREAGGEARHSTTSDGGARASVEMGVQSGHVTSVAPASVRYFRCNIAADQPIRPDLESYFTGLYGPPISKTDEATVWLVADGGATATADAAVSDDAALPAVSSAAVGASLMRIELTREQGADHARLTILKKDGAVAP